MFTFRRRSNSHSPGFTLVEILIVVTIIGILAAIVIPKFQGSSDAARATNAIAELQTARKQLEIWRVDHSGAYPTLVQIQAGANDWGVFTSKTDVDGTVNASGQLGPYFRNALQNIFNVKTNVVAAGAGTDTDGWTYNASTGEIRIVLPSTVDASQTKVTASDYEQP